MIHFEPEIDATAAPCCSLVHGANLYAKITAPTALLFGGFANFPYLCSRNQKNKQ